MSQSLKNRGKNKKMKMKKEKMTTKSKECVDDGYPASRVYILLACELDSGPSWLERPEGVTCKEIETNWRGRNLDSKRGSEREG